MSSGLTMTAPELEAIHEEMQEACKKVAEKWGVELTSMNVQSQVGAPQVPYRFPFLTGVFIGILTVLIVQVGLALIPK
jgi:hypothetical protein